MTEKVISSVGALIFTKGSGSTAPGAQTVSPMVMSPMPDMAMMLPAVAARCWVRTLPGLLLMAGVSGIFCAWLGLSLSWAVSLPAGPSIVLTASALFLVSVLFGTRSRLAGSLRTLF